MSTLHRHVPILAIAVALATGCAAAPETTARAPVPQPDSRAQRLREFRATIVALYRVPDAEALNALEPDPLDQLRTSLRRTYHGTVPIG